MDSSSLPAHAVEIDPESTLQFVLKTAEDDSEGTAPVPKCTMTLYHPGNTSDQLAFKVKTTQPRRYLVRPNQGIIAPGASESIAITLVEKDRQSLLQSYERLGQSALDHSKDKFLVQSCAVPPEFSTKFSSQAPTVPNNEYVENLTSMWVQANHSDEIAIYNKKLHVRHVVSSSESELDNDPFASSSATHSLHLNNNNATNTSASTSSKTTLPTTTNDRPPMEHMTQEQMVAEVSSLRRKYDELVAFSVNLTAERDILNNTLEQTKRDLSREMTARAVLETEAGSASKDTSPKPTSFLFTMIQMLIVALACTLGGIKLVTDGTVTSETFADVPVLSSFLNSP